MMRRADWGVKGDINLLSSTGIFSFNWFHALIVFCNEWGLGLACTPHAPDVETAAEWVVNNDTAAVKQDWVT